MKRKLKQVPRKPTRGRRPSAAPPAAHYPKGWDRKRAREIAEYYDNQSDAEAIAEAQAAYKDVTTAMMPIPIDLVPAVEQLIERRRKAG